MNTPTQKGDTYVVYKGDEVQVVGSAAECATFLGVNVGTVRFYASAVHRKRVAASVSPDERVIAERVKDE